MIARYTLEPMVKLWNRPETKFEYWLRVELAVLEARAKLGDVSYKISQRIAGVARVDVKRIEEIEAEIDHDLLAFVGQIQEVITSHYDQSYAAEFHKRLTSYDTEDPAFVLLLRDATTLVHDELLALEKALFGQAKKHQWTLMIARTHGQYAEPTTFGQLLLVFAEEVKRVRVRIRGLFDSELREAKISGAVGNYAGMDTRVEERALEILGLEPARAETQILQRDRHATVINTLAVAASVMEQVARTFWEMMRSEVRELEEPRRKKQKGSSAMPHKKNPITTERIMGLARVVRGNALAVMENVATPEWRDVSQSSVERVAIADAFTLVHYAAVKLRGVAERMTVFTDQMRRNLDEKTLGVWAGQQVRNALMEQGVDYETAYRYVQAASFEAVNTGIHVKTKLQSMPISEIDSRTAGLIMGEKELDKCFDAMSYVKTGIEFMFKQQEAA